MASSRKSLRRLRAAVKAAVFSSRMIAGRNRRKIQKSMSVPNCVMSAILANGKSANEVNVYVHVISMHLFTNNS